MSVAAMMLGLAVAAQQPELIEIRPAERLGSFKIPDEIAPAMVPYMQCLIARQGVPMYNERRQLIPPPVGKAADCDAVRTEAVRHADRMLRQHGVRDHRARTEQIEATLTKIEAFESRTGALYAEAVDVEALLNPEDGPAPINLPYQMVPAFMAYSDCVTARFRDDTRAGGGDEAQLRAGNADALAACRDVRAEQLKRSLELVTDYRLHGSRAAAHAAVRTAFDRFDSGFRIEAATDED